jgi:LacI family transcriptional regulator
MERTLRVVLAFPHEHGTVKGLYKGILEYSEEHPEFSFRHTGPHDLHGVKRLKGWEGDGVIASINSKEAIDILQGLDCPVVNISGAFEHTGFPRVIRDHVAIGKTAGEHLASTGVKSFAYIGIRNRWYSDRKRDGFRQFLRSAGYELQDLFIDKIDCLVSEEKAFNEISSWFDNLNLPAGLLLDTDSLYGMVCEICKERGWAIPSDLAILGINNFSSICLTHTPTLSSIEQAGTEYGYKAMKMLHDYIRGNRPKEGKEVTITGHRLHTRQSTEVTFVDNTKLNEAIKYIRANLASYFSMEDVVTVANCSRRWLETAFKDHLKTTPAQFIQRLRIQKAKQLRTDYPKLDLHQVSVKCGFSSKRHMVDVFKKIEGVDPSKI